MTKTEILPKATCRINQIRIKVAAIFRHQNLRRRLSHTEITIHRMKGDEKTQEGQISQDIHQIVYTWRP